MATKTFTVPVIMTSTFYVEIEMEVDDNMTEDEDYYHESFASIIDVADSNIMSMDMADEQVHLYTKYDFTTGGGIAEVDVDLFSEHYYDKRLKA